jgi:hypothetical protein
MGPKPHGQSSGSAGLRPITREVLKAYYAKHPLTPVPSTDELLARLIRVQNGANDPDATPGPHRLDLEANHRIDTGFYHNRCVRALAGGSVVESMQNFLAVGRGAVVRGW